MSKENLITYKRLPEYLRTYVVDQDYDRYTWREQACWRYIMRQSSVRLKGVAHPVYLEGLKKAGIPIAEIPNIEKMDEVLNRYGWGAVCVRGFIPPLAFLDFQARQVLPIAADMRTLEHLAYTPAPDIVHEAAGHAPIIADPGYAKFLKKYAEMARKSLFSCEDIKMYEAIRILSDVKENPDSSPEKILEAEQALEGAVATSGTVSEAAQVARMYWWTAEYGMIGTLEQPKLYGAGLLSSLHEAESSLRPDVKKQPLSLACIDQSYDITKPQPQLFVARDFEQVIEVLEELEGRLAFTCGGFESLEKARDSRALSSAVLDSGLNVTGIVEEILCLPIEGRKSRQVAFVRWSGGVQLAVAQKELPGHGTNRHPTGFSCPLGRWKLNEEKSPCDFTEADLNALGLVPGEKVKLEYCSGFLVTGLLVSREWGAGKLILLSFDDCRVTYHSKVYFEPEWGAFDLALGESIASVYGGPADWQNYQGYNFGRSSTEPGRSSPFSCNELALFDLYGQVRQMRVAYERDPELGAHGLEQKLSAMVNNKLSLFPNEWLLGLEIYELTSLVYAKKSQEHSYFPSLTAYLQKCRQTEYDAQAFIQRGIDLAVVSDRSLA